MSVRRASVDYHDLRALAWRLNGLAAVLKGQNTDTVLSREESWGIGALVSDVADAVTDCASLRRCRNPRGQSQTGLSQRRLILSADKLTRLYPARIKCLIADKSTKYTRHFSASVPSDRQYKRSFRCRQSQHKQHRVSLVRSDRESEWKC